MAAPTRRYGDAINDFVREAETFLEAEGLPVVFWVAGHSQLAPFVGYTGVGGGRDVTLAARRGEPFWVFAGPREDMTFEQWVAARPWQLELTEMCRTKELPWSAFWPGHVALYRAVPLSGPGPSPARAPAGDPAADR